ncbi:MAG: GDP-mannose 4,6-dehydratase [Elusimicrobia bacterium]|nr:GDP-mannose 4,6-dehydratase [Elusimicrobiota bacterium]MDE2426940.1 GDP-mannose 4,6-dehydratase [Elusimicrobiota bacterium]
MRRALVAGGGGFLGAAAAAALRRRGWKVLAARRSDADLADARQARRLLERWRPALIVHAAGATGAMDWGRAWDAHVATTLGLLDAVSALKLPARLVVAGSAAEYGAAAGNSPVREDCPLAPTSVYGASKRSQTLAALSCRDIPVVVARIFNSCGPGCPEGLVPGAFVRQLADIARGRRPPVLEVGNLSSSRDFLDARDIAAALAALGKDSVAPGIYNVCSGTATPIRSLLDRLIALCGLPVELRQVAVQRQSGDVRSVVGDPSKLRRATGWRPRIALDESLRDAIKALPSNNMDTLEARA